MSEPMKVCPDCRQPEGEFHIERERGDHPISARLYTYPARRLSWSGAIVGAVLVDDEPVPGMDQPYPAVEPDLDSRDEYEKEDAPLLQEDRR